MNKSPCVQECPRRTTTCKVDGSCREFIAYEKERMERYEERKKEGEKNYAANPWHGEGRRRSIRKKDRYKMKKMRRGGRA